MNVLHLLLAIIVHSEFCIKKGGAARVGCTAFPIENYTTPWSIIASATFRKPAMFAPAT